MSITIARSLFGLALAIVLTIVLTWAAASPGAAQDDGEIIRQGQALLATHCSRCHAIGLTGDSPDRQAPAFRDLGDKYPVEWLAEALAEGLSTGHPDMPEFVFEPGEINAILAYLRAIQVPKAGPPQGR